MKRWADLFGKAFLYQRGRVAALAFLIAFTALVGLGEVPPKTLAASGTVGLVVRLTTAPVAGIRLRAFAAATFLGILPMTSIFASIGASLGAILAKGERPDMSIVFSLPVLGPLLGLAVLSLTPLLWKKWRSRDA